MSVSHPAGHSAESSRRSFIITHVFWLCWLFYPTARLDVGGPVTTEELFHGRRCLLVSVPGAFTTICDAVHLPGFVERHDEIKACRFDDVMFMSVNDSAVMAAWSASHGAADKVQTFALL